MKQIVTNTFEELKKRLNYFDKKDQELIEKAYEFANEKHFGQLRKTGEEYIIHPLNVASILTEIYADILFFLKSL